MPPTQTVSQPVGFGRAPTAGRVRECRGDVIQHRIDDRPGRVNGVLAHPDGKRVFVTSGGNGSVQVIDTSSQRIVAEVPVGRRPWNMALTPDGRKLYVACGRSNAIAVVDATSYAKTGEIAVGSLPWGVAIR